MCAVVAAIGAAVASAADGDVDTTFGFGAGVVHWGGVNDTIKARDAVARSDGWIIAVGSYDSTTQAPAVHWQSFDRDGVNQATHGCYSTSPNLIDNSSSSEAEAVILDSSGRLVFGGYGIFGSNQVGIIGGVNLSQTGCTLDTSFVGVNGWVPFLHSHCDPEDCEVIDLAEIRPATGAVTAPRIIALVESHTTASDSEYFLAAYDLDGHTIASFGTSGSVEIASPVIGTLVGGGTARMDITGQGEIRIALTRRDTGPGDLDLVVARYSATGAQQDILVFDFDDGTGREVSDVVSHPSLFALSLAFRGTGGGLSGVFHSVPKGYTELWGTNQRFLVARQGDGKVVTASNSLSTDGTVLRRSILDYDEALDETYPTHTFDLDLGGDNRQEIEKLLLSAGRPVLVGTVHTGASTSDAFVARFQNSHVFADGFESTNRAYWSTSLPSP